MPLTAVEGAVSSGCEAFADAIERSGLAPLIRDRVTTLQVNVGKRCNMACHHCHVEAGPNRSEVMTQEVAGRIKFLIEANPELETLDLTGGAPELNPNFRDLVTFAAERGLAVIDRCNLTILLWPGMEGLVDFLAANKVRVVASLPCYTSENVRKQRGEGAFEKSIEALQRLNAAGYGNPGSGLSLDLVYNPVGAFLPPSQEKLRSDYERELGRRFGIRFNDLLTITNMPIKRFARFLSKSGQRDRYMGLLVNHFNPATVPGLMCRTMVSVGWDGQLYDCDFNQMLDLPLGTSGKSTVWDVETFDRFAGGRIETGSHCFGCTAGAGSSCGGALS